MPTWRDAFTGTLYNVEDGWVTAVKKHLANTLTERLSKTNDLKAAADEAALFWRGYYGLVFPLRFGRDPKSTSFDEKHLLPGDGDEVRLSEELAHLLGLRTRGLDGAKLPPILPSLRPNQDAELAADRALCTAAMANVLLRSAGVAADELHACRLGCLIAPLRAELADAGLNSLPSHVLSIAAFMDGEDMAVPDEARGVLTAVREGTYSPEHRVCLVLAQVQRVQKYVFDTPGLNEVRGASTILDEICDRLADDIGREIGPEALLRSAGSAVMMVAPTNGEGAGPQWPARMKRAFVERTGAVFATAACETVAAGDLWGAGYRSAVGQVYLAVERERQAGGVPLIETLPFEERCSLCQRRPAEGWYRTPDNELASICAVCLGKRETGRRQRGKARVLLEHLGLPDDPQQIGVMSGASVPNDLESLIPGGEEARRQLVAVICGDGNNFGGVVNELDSLSASIQWTHRVEEVTWSAAALAVAGATKQISDRYGQLDAVPFQILALGGDDLSLFAAPVAGLEFAARFLKLTDMEFQRGHGKVLGGKRISFSLGVLICDVKAPVQRTVGFAEHQLLGGWAKRAMKAAGSGQGADDRPGNVAVLVAQSPEDIPSDLDRYRNEVYWGGGVSTSANGQMRLCLTLRPFTAAELEYLLKLAVEVHDKHLGRLQRMLVPFAKDRPLAAMLHYAYQSGRSRELHDTLSGAGNGLKALPDTMKSLRYPAAPMPGRRPLGVEPTDENVWFSALWDVLEFAKLVDKKKEVEE